jgi:hypothetical protein
MRTRLRWQAIIVEGHGDDLSDLGIDLVRDDLRQWMSPDELREAHIIEHGMPGAEPAPLSDGEAETLARRLKELLATAAERRRSGEPRIWRWEDYPEEGPPLFP